MEISETIHLLGDLLGRVLINQESQDLFDAEEQIRSFAKQRRADNSDQAAEGEKNLSQAIHTLKPATARVVASAFALYFDLVNSAEDHSRLAALRNEALRKSLTPVHDSIEEAIAQMKASGISADQMGNLLARLQIELVLTAHPTESRRRTILSKIQRINSILQTMNQPEKLPSEIERSHQDLLHQITLLWLTDRARLAQPTPTDEVKTTLYFVGQVFWAALPEIYERLQTALDRYYPGLKVDHCWFKLASWIGGDRDGNPNVTVDVTAETLHLHRGLAIENHRRTFQDLSRQLSLSSRRVALPPSLAAWIEKRPPLSPHAAHIQQRYPAEPYRLILSLLAGDLAEASQDDMKSRLLSQASHTARIRKADLATPLREIYQAVPETARLSEMDTALRQLEIFDLYGARLDLREDSARINAALAEVLRALAISPDFELQDASKRCDLIIKLLSEPAPALSAQPGASPRTAETWAIFQLIRRTRAVYGPELFGPFIISMAHSTADVLAVLLMAHWCGCANGLEIVPLFETIQDLEDAPHIMTQLFSLTEYQAHLSTCPNGQMVMIGYSDSNKDGGFMMSNWALYQAQEKIAQVCREHGVALTLFHGRGGTAARGGGPVNRAILAQPGGSVNGRFRLTEQGEILSSRYSNIELAMRNLEQIVNAVLLASAPSSSNMPTLAAINGYAPLHLKLVSPTTLPNDWRNSLEQMAATALTTYRHLVYETPGFMDYWNAATPIQQIKTLHIGSRPASRKPGVEQVNQIRAIPWVFSWMQSRFNLPGWFGLGSGLQKILSDHSSGQQTLRQMHAEWAFFRMLLETAELSLMKADMQIARLYSELVPDQTLAEPIFHAIQAEYERTVNAVLTIKGQAHLMDSDPVIQRSIQLRNPYVDPLNYLQVDMLRRLRQQPDPNSATGQEIQEVILMTINGIAAGLRNTG